MDRIKPKKLTSQDDYSVLYELLRWSFVEICHFFYQSSTFCYKFILRHQVLTFINMVVLSVNLIFIWGFRKWRSRKVHHLPSPLSDRSSSCNKLLRRLKTKAYSGETYQKKTRLRNTYGKAFMKPLDIAPPSAGDYVTADCDVGRRHSSTQQTSGDHDETLDEITWGFDTSPMLSYHPPPPAPETDHVVKPESISSADGNSQRSGARAKKRKPKCDLKRKKVIIAKKFSQVESYCGRDRRKREKVVIDKFVNGASSEHCGSPAKATKKQLTPRVPVARSVKSQCPPSETTSSKKSSTLQETPRKASATSRTVSPKKSVQKNAVTRPLQDHLIPRVSISPEKFFLQNKAVHESDLSSESDQAEKVPAPQGLTMDSRSEASNVCKRDSWIWFSREARPSMESFASRQRKFKSEDPRVAELAAEIRRQDEMNRDIEREAESLIESSSQSNKIASTQWTQQPMGLGLQTASRVRARGRIRPSPYARHNTNPAVTRSSMEPERKLLPSARVQRSPQKYLVHYLKDNAIDGRKARSDVKMSLRTTDISFTSSEGDVMSRAGAPWSPYPKDPHLLSPNISPHERSGDLEIGPSTCPYDSLSARKIVPMCGRMSPPNDNSTLLSSLDSSLTFNPVLQVKAEVQAEDRFLRSLSLTPSQEIPPVLFNVQNSIGSPPFRNYPNGRIRQPTGTDPRQAYSANARIQSQGRVKLEKMVHLSAGDSESDSLQKEMSQQESSLRQVLITKEVNTAIHRLLFDTEQSSSSLSPSSLNKQSARGILPRDINAITYAHHPADEVKTQKTCGFKNNVSVQYSVQANPQESSSFKSDSALRLKRTNIYNPEYYLGKRVTCKRQMTVVNQTESTTESSSNRWRKKSRPRGEANSPVVYSSEHSTPIPSISKAMGDSVIEKAQLLNQRKPEAVRATPMSGPTQRHQTDSTSDLSLGRQDVVLQKAEETGSTGNGLTATRRSNIPILSRSGSNAHLSSQSSDTQECKKQIHEPSSFLNRQIGLVPTGGQLSNFIKVGCAQPGVCVSASQPIQRASAQAGHTRKPSKSHDVILPSNKTPSKVINIGLRSKPLDISNRLNKPEVISLQDFSTRVSTGEMSNLIGPGDVRDMAAKTASVATDQSQSAVVADINIQGSTTGEQPAVNSNRGSCDAASLASDIRAKPQKVVTYSDSYWARKVATKQAPSDGPQKSPSLVLGRSESCHLLKSSSQNPLRVSSSSDHVSGTTKTSKPASGVSGLSSHVVTGSTNNSSSNAPYQRVGEVKTPVPTTVGQFFFVTATSATAEKPPVYSSYSFLNISNTGSVGDGKVLEKIPDYRSDLDPVCKHPGDGDALGSELRRKPSSLKDGLLPALKGASPQHSDSKPGDEDSRAGTKPTHVKGRVVKQKNAGAVNSRNSCSSDDTEPSQLVLPPTSSDEDDDDNTNDVAERAKRDGSQGEHFMPTTTPLVQGDQFKPTVAPTVSNQDSGYEESMSDKAQKTTAPSDELVGLQARSPTGSAVTGSSSSCSEGSHNSEGFTNVSRTSEECDSDTQWTSSMADNAYVSTRCSTSSRLSKFTISKSQRPLGDMNRGCASSVYNSQTHDVQNGLSKANFSLFCKDERTYSDLFPSGSATQECRPPICACEGSSEAPITYLTKGLERVKLKKANVVESSVEAGGKQKAPGNSQRFPLQKSSEKEGIDTSATWQSLCGENRLSQKKFPNVLCRPNPQPLDCTMTLVPSKIWPSDDPMNGGKDKVSPKHSLTRESILDASCSTSADVRMLESLLSSELGEPFRDPSPCHSSNTSLDLSTSLGLSTFEESDTRHRHTADTFTKGLNGENLVPKESSRACEASKSLDPFPYDVSQTFNPKRDASSANSILLPPTSSDEEDEKCPRTYDCGSVRDKNRAMRSPLSLACPATNMSHSRSPIQSRDHASDNLEGKTYPGQRTDNSCRRNVHRRVLIPKRSVKFEELLKRF